MKVLVFGINFYPELTGIGKYTGEMVRWLVDQGHEVDVVTAPPYYPQWKVSSGYSSWSYRRESLDGTDERAQVLRCPLWIPSDVSGVTRLIHLATFALSSIPGLLWGLLRRPDVMVVVIPTLLQTPQSLALAKLAGVPTWLHVQDFEVDAAMDMGLLGASGHATRPGVFRRCAIAVESFFLRRFDRVSSISGAMVGRLLSKGVSPERVVEFPNWVDLSSVYPVPLHKSMRAELGVPEDKTLVLYSGNMGEKQGLDILIEAAKMLGSATDIHFVLAGSGSARDRLQEQSQGCANVSWIPLQPMNKLNALLNAADVHVLPQRADAADLVMPSKLTGMLASGKAVVGTAEAETELGQVLDACGLRVAPGNASALAQAIKDLSMDVDRRAALGTAGRQYAERTLDKDCILFKFQGELEKLISRRCPA